MQFCYAKNNFLHCFVKNANPKTTYCERKYPVACIYTSVGLIGSRTWWVAPETAAIITTYDDTFSIPAKGCLDISGVVA